MYLYLGLNPRPSWSKLLQIILQLHVYPKVSIKIICTRGKLPMVRWNGYKVAMILLLTDDERWPLNLIVLKTY